MEASDELVEDIINIYTTFEDPPASRELATGVEEPIGEVEEDVKQSLDKALRHQSPQQVGTSDPTRKDEHEKPRSRARRRLRTIRNTERKWRVAAIIFSAQGKALRKKANDSARAGNELRCELQHEREEKEAFRVEVEQLSKKSKTWNAILEQLPRWQVQVKRMERDARLEEPELCFAEQDRSSGRA